MATPAAISYPEAASDAEPGSPRGSEEWRWIPGWEQRYDASSLGRIRSHVGPREIPWKRPRILRPGVSDSGHLYVALKGNVPCKVHRLVASAFHGLPDEGQLCRHLDGNPSNNQPSNLAWGTHQDNSDDMLRHGTRQFGEVHHSTYLTEDQVREIYSLRGVCTSRTLAAQFGATRKTIMNIWQGISWGWLTGA